MDDDEDESDTLDAAEIRGWAEFCAWSALVMTPIIWWLQGASVSNDQFVVRTGLVVLSAVVAVGLRLWAIFSKRGVAHDREGTSGEAGPPGGPLKIEPRP